MKLQDLLQLAENNTAAQASATNDRPGRETSGTTSLNVARYDKILDDEPVKRMADKKNKNSFMKYATAKECPGCKIINQRGWQEVAGAKTASKDLVCQMCGKTHTKGSK